MPQSPDWKRVLETGMQFTELRRSQAHRLANDLVAQGQLARDQVGAAVDELIEISRSRSEELRKVVELRGAASARRLGLATGATSPRWSAACAARRGARGLGQEGAEEARPRRRRRRRRPRRRRPPRRRRAAKKTAAKKARPLREEGTREDSRPEERCQGGGPTRAGQASALSEGAATPRCRARAAWARAESDAGRRRHRRGPGLRRAARSRRRRRARSTPRKRSW